MEYLTAPQVQARYHISDTTLYRWVKDPGLGFPRPKIIRRRKYFKETELVEWDALQRAEEAA